MIKLQYSLVYIHIILRIIAIFQLSDLIEANHSATYCIGK